MKKVEKRTHSWIFQWTQAQLEARISLIDNTAKMTLKEIKAAKNNPNHIPLKK